MKVADTHTAETRARQGRRSAAADWTGLRAGQQVLTLRERGYILMARRSGAGTFEVLTRELLPNLLPFLAASFVAAVALAILSSIGLEALGLGPQNEPTLGMTVYWAIRFNAQLRGLWWWWTPPLVVIIATFIGLFLISMGLDQIANPKLESDVMIADFGFWIRVPSGRCSTFPLVVTLSPCHPVTLSLCGAVHG